MLSFHNLKFMLDYAYSGETRVRPCKIRMKRACTVTDPQTPIMRKGVDPLFPPHASWWHGKYSAEGRGKRKAGKRRLSLTACKSCFKMKY